MKHVPVSYRTAWVTVVMLTVSTLYSSNMGDMGTMLWLLPAASLFLDGVEKYQGEERNFTLVYGSVCLLLGAGSLFAYGVTTKLWLMGASFGMWGLWIVAGGAPMFLRRKADRAGDS